MNTSFRKCIHRFFFLCKLYFKAWFLSFGLVLFITSIKNCQMEFQEFPITIILITFYSHIILILLSKYKSISYMINLRKWFPSAFGKTRLKVVSSSSKYFVAITLHIVNKKVFSHIGRYFWVYRLIYMRLYVIWLYCTSRQQKLCSTAASAAVYFRACR